MMKLEVKFMEPIHTVVVGRTLRLIFDEEYLMIMRDGEPYHFKPVEGNVIVYNLDTQAIENLSDVFVFERCNRFIRMTLYQFMFMENALNLLQSILDTSFTTITPTITHNKVSKEVEKFVAELEHQQLMKAIDQTIADKNQKLFYELTAQLPKKEALQWN